ncbi:MAG: IS4 family transposase ISAcma16 [Chroococcidiopsis cubana SAG 39.79]|uniref:IS4 family transposase n=1 Tax=Chroococcidiopsis cubana SAG 39.79 TaxID=388085 RepID=A0AB37U864_9CYAN|nr:IS4 family transposase [Chroococcidiopsis cubana]MDZ4872194.1 IS4 family transposase ISAcma16 [Chroococcidiopsis cubana SAG 39.79]PSB61898.1 IS4 family transposase [Chroococcidiopsis cubana CCALA 043]RUS93934.1 IS4 family transposase [Chroococcidiopsis cubana SAG 39.79]
MEILKEKFTKSLGLPFQELLPESAIQQVLDELKIKYRCRLFDPFVTLWAFLSQVLDTDKSCHSAVSKIIAYLAGEGVELPSTDTSGYCQARARIPEKLLEKLFGRAAKSLEEKVTCEYLWCGRNVKVIDGSTVSMPDTLENQKAYPQPKTQKPGCGFPIAKIGVIFSLATGAAVALCIDVLNTHDIKLARKLYQFLNPLDILLGDRAFCAYADIAAIKNLGCEAIFRKHQSRTTSIRKGRIVGNCDKLVTWYKPKICPKGLSKDDFDALPPSRTVREIYYYIIIPGFRTQRVSLITTLLDTTTYSSLKLVELYGKRWHVELDLRHLKSTLGMDVLRCLTPSMVRKEIYVYLLAYNLLRSLMWSAGTTYGTSPLRLSLQGTRHHLNNFIPQLLVATSTQRHQIYRTFLKVIVHKVVPTRPGRSEPRVRKRRPKSYPLMKQPRHELRRQLQTA